jgi:hypothetical protein
VVANETRLKISNCFKWLFLRQNHFSACALSSYFVEYLGSGPLPHAYLPAHPARVYQGCNARGMKSQIIGSESQD